MIKPELPHSPPNLGQPPQPTMAWLRSEVNRFLRDEHGGPVKKVRVKSIEEVPGLMMKLSEELADCPQIFDEYGNPTQRSGPLTVRGKGPDGRTVIYYLCWEKPGCFRSNKVTAIQLRRHLSREWANMSEEEMERLREQMQRQKAAGRREKIKNVRKSILDILFNPRYGHNR